MRCGGELCAFSKITKCWDGGYPSVDMVDEVRCKRNVPKGDETEILHISNLML